MCATFDMPLMFDYIGRSKGAFHFEKLAHCLAVHASGLNALHTVSTGLQCIRAATIRGVTGIPCSRHYHCCRGHIVRVYAEAMYSHAPL